MQVLTFADGTELEVIYVQENSEHFQDMKHEGVQFQCAPDVISLDELNALVSDRGNLARITLESTVSQMKNDEDGVPVYNEDGRPVCEDVTHTKVYENYDECTELALRQVQYSEVAQGISGTERRIVMRLVQKTGLELEDAAKGEALTVLGVAAGPAAVGFAANMRAGIDALLANLTEEEAVLHPELHMLWSGDGVAYTKGAIIRYNNELYKCLQNHNSQSDWNPASAGSLWVEISDPAEEWPAWKQPAGAHDAYAMGSKVTDDGVRWISVTDSNVWRPGVYGWERAE